MIRVLDESFEFMTVHQLQLILLSSIVWRVANTENRF